jgi:hypothetical protein
MARYEAICVWPFGDQKWRVKDRHCIQSLNEWTGNEADARAMAAAMEEAIPVNLRGFSDWFASLNHNSEVDPPLDYQIAKRDEMLRAWSAALGWRKAEDEREFENWSIEQVVKKWYDLHPKAMGRISKVTHDEALGIVSEIEVEVTPPEQPKPVEEKWTPGRKWI